LAETAKACLRSRTVLSCFALLFMFCFAINALSSSHGVGPQGQLKQPSGLKATPSKKSRRFGSWFDAATLREVRAYVRSLLQGGQQSTMLPGDPASGKTLFFGKVGGAKCHMVERSCGFVGADLLT